MSKKPDTSTGSDVPLGKLANDHNKAGDQAPTQTNQARRTPHSRSDREDQMGGSNQPETRRTGAGVKSNSQR